VASTCAYVNSNKGKALMSVSNQNTKAKKEKKGSRGKRNTDHSSNATYSEGGEWWVDENLGLATGKKRNTPRKYREKKLMR